MKDESEIYKVGESFFWMGGDAKIMAIVNNWIMARKRGCVPFCVFIKDMPKKEGLWDE